MAEFWATTNGRRFCRLIELDLSRLPEGTPKIASYDVKFEKK